MLEVLGKGKDKAGTCSEGDDTIGNETFSGMEKNAPPRVREEKKRKKKKPFRRGAGGGSCLEIFQTQQK